MQVIFNRSGTPTIHNVLLDTIDAERGCVEITFDDIKHEPVEFESLYPYFINGQLTNTHGQARGVSPQIYNTRI